MSDGTPLQAYLHRPIGPKTKTKTKTKTKKYLFKVDIWGYNNNSSN